MDAALTVFAQRGFRGTRTKEIAQVAGISETLIFQHFKSKEDLYREALGNLFGRHPVLEELEDEMRLRDDRAVFTNLAGHLTHHNRKDPRILRLAMYSALEGIHFGEIARDGGAKRRPTLPEILAGYIEQRIKEGAFKRTNALIVATLFIETVFMYAADQQTSISGPPLPSTEEEVIKTLVGLYLDGLKA
jgi:TetR/AcrR family transcriptional regulator